MDGQEAVFIGREYYRPICHLCYTSIPLTLLRFGAGPSMPGCGSSWLTSAGSVKATCRIGGRVRGSCYPWTRKVKGKTVCVALSKERYEWLKEAIANWRRVQRILRRMRQLSREELFAMVPGRKRRKKLSKRVLGLV